MSDLFRFYIYLVVISTLLTSGCAVSVDQSNNTSKKSVPTESMANLIIPEPVPASLRAQQALAKFNIIVMSPELTEDERAELLFKRGLLHDSVGLPSLAFLDFKQALRFNPRLYQAYNSIGIYHTVRNDYIEAYESFDAVLEMNNEYEFAYLNRGMALYYAGRAELAVPDMQRYYEQQPGDAYRLLWRYFAAHQVDPEQAFTQLQQDSASLEQGLWVNNIVAFYLGELSQSVLLSSILEGIDTRNQMNERLCEAYFYLGKFYRHLGQEKVASNFFKLALSTNIFEFVEHRFARVELAAIRNVNMKP